MSEFPTRNPDFWYDLAKEKLGRQLADVDAVDSKLSAFLSAGSAVIGIQLAVYALEPSRFGFWPIRALIVAAVAFGVLSLVALVGLVTRRWGVGPNIRDLEADAEAGLEETELKWKATSRYVADFETNQPKIDLKVLGLKVAVVSLVAETASVAFGLFSVAHPI
jgi:hypothetical protein